MEAKNSYWQIAKSTCKFYMSRLLIKSWRTDSIRLQKSGAQMYVDPSENRGSVLIIMNGLTQPRLNHFWEQAVLQFQPELVFDVGVNYGECLFSTRYPEHCHIIGIEANLSLQPYIERTLTTHPNKQQIQIVYALASDGSTSSRPFYVNKYWSGISSAVEGKELFRKAYDVHMVEEIDLDSLYRQQGRLAQRVLFKIDVEGFEPKVLDGMQAMIQSCPEMLGFIEFDSEYIERAGYDVDQYLQKLQRDFRLYVYLSNRELVHSAKMDMNLLRNLFDKKQIHTDIIAVSRAAELPLLQITQKQA